MTTSLPFKVTDWWREQLGTLQSEEIESSDLYLITTLSSGSLEILDAENNDLIDKCRNLFYAFLLSGHTCTESDPKLVTGSMKENEATFRSISDFEHPTCISGIRIPSIDENRMELTASLYRGLKSVIYDRKIKGRVIRAINCYLDGIKSSHVYEKIMNCIRTMEAFLLPEIGKTERQFKSRTELFIGPGKQELVGLIYKVRSAIEHLHNPLDIIDGSTVKEKFIGLLEVGVIAESIARYCVNRLLLKPDTWDHFATDDSIRAFWRKTNKERQAIWGDKMDISTTLAGFDRSQVHYQEDIY